MPLTYALARALGAAVALLLAACGPAGGGKTETLPAIHAGFDHAFPDLLVVEIVDPSPLSAARLIRPDGGTDEAFRIDRDRTDPQAGGAPGVGLAVGGGNVSGVGTTIGIGIPIFAWGSEPAPPLIRSSARFKIADMVLYRAGWQRWIIRLNLGESGAGGRAIDVPAPAPF